MSERSRPGRLTRRRLLEHAGVSAAALPFLLGRARSAHAAGPPLRFILWPMLNGAEAQHFWPNPGNLAAMSVVTEPLRAYQKSMTFVRGVNISGSENHYAVRSMFSGFNVSSYMSGDPTVKSADQLVADHFATTGPSPLRSLHLGVIPADSISFYQRVGRSTFFFAPKPVDYEANPVTAYDRVFSGGGGGAAPPPPSPMGMPAVDYTNDILDLTDAELGELSQLLRDSTGERAKIDQHREALRSLRPAPAGTPPVAPPAPPPTGTLASVEKLRPALQGKAADAYKSQYFSDIFDAQVDILARAVVSGLTRVATLQAGSADGNAIVPVEGGRQHHNTSHGNQTIFSKCQQWYSTKFARLLQALDVPDPLDKVGGKTVLYNSVILLLAECLPVSHSSAGVPCLVAGNGGGLLRAGGYINSGMNNKAVIQTLLGMFGVSPGVAGHFGSTTISELRA
jgi:hypothetical protein